MFHNATPEATKPAPVKTVNELSKSSVELTEAKFKRYNLRSNLRKRIFLEWKRSAMSGTTFDAEIRPPCFSKGNQQEHHDARLCGLSSARHNAWHNAWYKFDDKCKRQIMIIYSEKCMVYILIIWYLIEQRPGALVLLRLGFGDRTWLYVTGDSTCIYLHDLHHQETQTIAQTAAWEVNMPPKGKVTKAFLDFGTSEAVTTFQPRLWLTICAWVCMRSHGSPFKPRENFKSHLPSFNSVFKQLKHWSHLTLLACENCIATF